MIKCFFKFLMIFSFCIIQGNAQNLSKNHTVKKGETVYGLSKKYNVSIANIIKLNPSAAQVIYSGEILKIPASNDNSDNTTPTIAEDSTKIKNLLAYKVKSGDTKFGLSKRFGISIATLENQNRHIKNGLQAGHILKIVNSNYSQQSENTNTSTTKKSGSSQWHEVIKGDTFYAISKLYAVNLGLLIKTNPLIIAEKMSIGARVRIPNQALDSQISIKNKTDYLVKKGDTKFGLSKAFTTTIEELENLNPQIINMLRAGITIKIPSNLSDAVTNRNDNQNALNASSNNSISNKTESQTIKDSIYNALNSFNTEKGLTTNIKDSAETKTMHIVENKSNVLNYKNYVIEPKETLYGLSKKAGLSIPEFLKLNPELSKSVIVGTIIKMPTTNSGSSLKTNFENINSNKNLNPYTNLSTLITSTKNKKILMLMPFNDIEFDYYNKNAVNYEAVSNPNLRDGIQFYRGVKTALDSLSEMGVKIEINLLKIEDLKTDKLLNISKLDSYNAIITMQFDKEIEKALLLKTNTDDLPIISLDSKFENYESNLIFQALPSTYTQKLKTLQSINNRKGNIIVISDYDRIDSRSFIKQYSPDAQMFITNTKDEYLEKDIISKLDKNRTNYIIIDSNKNGIFLSATTLLLRQVSKYNIQLVVLEPSLLPNNQQISSKRFRILKLIRPDINQITNSQSTLKYFSSYKLKYNSEPSTKALQGFDIAFDTALRLSQNIEFENTAKTYKTSYITLKFDYIINKFKIYDNNEIIIREFND